LKVLIIRKCCYIEVLRERKPVGKKSRLLVQAVLVLILQNILSHEGESGSLNPQKFYDEWGIDTAYEHVVA
jgi:2,4-dienoyl-CoA reductase (NADPH2)